MTPSRCSSCGATWRPQALYCGGCGAAAPDAATTRPTGTDATRAPSGTTPARGTSGVVVAVVVAMVAVAGIAVGVALGTRDGGDGGDGGEQTGGGSPTTAVRVTPPSPTTASSSVAPTSSPSTDAPTTAPPSRSATLYSDEAFLRAAPSVDADDIRKFEGRSGMPLAVLSPIDENGWYRVRADGTEGFMFGAFVTPPDPGYCVAEAISGEPAITDDHGTVMVARGQNPSGSKVLLTPGTVLSSSIWPVVLADGRRGWYVQADEMKQPVC